MKSSRIRVLAETSLFHPTEQNMNPSFGFWLVFVHFMVLICFRPN